jgi:hypothetical protein
LENEEWLKAIAGEANWVIQPVQLRLKCFEGAGIAYE